MTTQIEPLEVTHMNNFKNSALRNDIIFISMKNRRTNVKSEMIQYIAQCAIVLESSSSTLHSPAPTLRIFLEVVDVLLLIALVCRTTEVWKEKVRLNKIRLD